MALKAYSTIDEALEDIQFKQDKHKKITLIFDKERAYVPQIGGFFDWIIKNLNHLGQTEKIQHDILNLLVELISNAYRHGVEHHPSKTCSVETYIGKKGILSGTKQNIEFLADKQIKLLKEGKKVPSIDPYKESCNAGTEMFIEDGNGILIDKPKKAIYISKYFAKESSKKSNLF